MDIMPSIIRRWSMSATATEQGKSGVPYVSAAIVSNARLAGNKGPTTDLSTRKALRSTDKGSGSWLERFSNNLSNSEVLHPLVRQFG
ncbi:hypothetical protein BU23DRAFT_556624 [Bimuria novae-zelandiae CBS 107.79]|uniref:Uncharacterized protein n=1 Tax=Bimuria novae-zelandiae CBS 107.79 TaxID=1447943 RepID=A0A6A5UZS0_9PLEO|nr:hypothetical protein BU23DRAFT_556624 [Bimuria novae-zelandiae CBS 107.79]